MKNRSRGQPGEGRQAGRTAVIQRQPEEWRTHADTPSVTDGDAVSFNSVEAEKIG